MTWLTMVLVGLGSYAFRVVPLLVLPKLELSAGADRILRHAGAAALTALVVTSITGRADGGDARELVATVAAIASATALAPAGRAMLHVVAAGAAVYGGVMLLCTVLA